MFSLPIAGADLVLGVAWLATLGPHILDYNALTFKFYVHGKFITLNGENLNYRLQLNLIILVESMSFALFQNFLSCLSNCLILLMIMP